MAKRSETPGLVRRARAGEPSLYWSAESLSRKATDYPDRWIRLPHGATPAEIVDLCEVYTARLALWLERGPPPRFLYDGTIGSLCDAYERHPDSPINEVRLNTAGSYRDSLKVVRSTVAKRAVRALAPIDVKGWYARWRAPAGEGGSERTKRAHDAVAAVRMILRFGQALGYDECGRLAEGLAALRFERSRPRTAGMTVGHARAFIAAAIKLDPTKFGARGLFMAIGVAAQFETMLRQKDVIGEWRRDPAGDSWSGAFTWENIPGGILRLKTSKTGAPIAHDLTRLELLWPLLQRVPQAERFGAIVKGDKGAPMREVSYRKWYRQIARLAGVPDDIWSMDARAGAVTEALEAGADISAVQRAATHTSAAMTARYDRSQAAAVTDVAEARKRSRNVT